MKKTTRIVIVLLGLILIIFYLINITSDVAEAAGLEINETPVDCAIRELREELALEISELEEIYHADLVFDDVVWSAHFYFAGVVKGKPTLNEPHKIEGVQFISDLEHVSFSKDLQPLFDYLKASDILQDKVTEWR